MLVQSLLAAITLAAYVHAHAEPLTPFSNHPMEVARRQLEMNKRHVMARNCAPQVAAYQKNRKAKRALRRRGAHGDKHEQPVHQHKPSHPTKDHGGHASTSAATWTGSTAASSMVITSHPPSTIEATSDSATSTLSAVVAHYSTIQNVSPLVLSVGPTNIFSSLVRAYIPISGLTHELSQRPYYLRDDYVRQDLREDQNGTTLIFDIGVLDMETCQPATNTFVEIWNCNAQGEYAAFGSASIPGGVFPSGGIPSGSVSGSVGPFPTGGIPGATKISADNFLRGGYITNDDGVAELTTIYPGFYSGRTIHTHVMIHQNISYHGNGTIISASGALRHVGQIFYDEAINALVMDQDIYKNTNNTRTYNAQDGLLSSANQGGYSAFAEIEWLGDTLDEGLLGYITIGIDTTALRNITTSNYWDPDFSAEVTE